MDQFTGGCHCLDCRKHHGAVFHASAIFPEQAVNIDGEARAYGGRQPNRRLPGCSPSQIWCTTALPSRCFARQKRAS